jgi:hypothetical protein
MVLSEDTPEEGIHAQRRGPQEEKDQWVQCESPLELGFTRKSWLAGKMCGSLFDLRVCTQVVESKKIRAGLSFRLGITHTM